MWGRTGTWSRWTTRLLASCRPRARPHCRMPQSRSFTSAARPESCCCAGVPRPRLIFLTPPRVRPRLPPICRSESHACEDDDLTLPASACTFFCASIRSQRIGLAGLLGGESRMPGQRQPGQTMVRSQSHPTQLMMLGYPKTTTHDASPLCDTIFLLCGMCRSCRLV